MYAIFHANLGQQQGCRKALMIGKAVAASSRTSTNIPEESCQRVVELGPSRPEDEHVVTNFFMPATAPTAEALLVGLQGLTVLPIDDSN